MANNTEPFTITLDKYGVHPTPSAYIHIPRDVVEEDIIAHLGQHVSSYWAKYQDIDIGIRGHNDAPGTPSLHARLECHPMVLLRKDQCVLAGSWYRFVTRYELHEGSNVTLQYVINLESLVVTPQKNALARV